MTQHEGDPNQLQTNFDRSNFGPTQVQSTGELHPGWYIYHQLGKSPQGETTEVTCGLKILGVAQDGKHALLQWRGVDEEPYMDDFPLFKLGLVQGVNGEWYSGGWLEDLTKAVKA